MTTLERCHVCGGPARPVTERREMQIGKREVSVDVDFVRCDQCGEEFFLPGQLQAAQIRAANAIREREGLLEAEAIRGIRERCGLTQSQFERLLRVGPKTVVRWERGTVFQNAATDQLLRLIGDDLENARRLAERNAPDLVETIYRAMHGEVQGASHRRPGASRQRFALPQSSDVIPIAPHIGRRQRGARIETRLTETSIFDKVEG